MEDALPSGEMIVWRTDEPEAFCRGHQRSYRTTVTVSSTLSIPQTRHIACHQVAGRYTVEVQGEPNCRVLCTVLVKSESSRAVLAVHATSQHPWNPQQWR